MDDNYDSSDTVESSDDGWKTKVLIIGAVIGAVVGAGAAYLMIQNAEQQNQKPSVSGGDGVKLGLLVLGVLRQVAELGSGK